MVRISSVDLPGEKRVETGLTYIYGIDRASSNHILVIVGVNPNTHVKDLIGDEAEKPASVVAETQTVEGSSHREIVMNTKGLQEIRYHRGIRHRKSLPARNQETRASTRACKGPRETVTNKKK